MDSLKITPKKPKKKPTSQVLKGKAGNKVKMLCRKMENGTATDDDLGEAIELMRIINDPPKPGTPGYAALLSLRNLVQEKQQQARQEAREAGPSEPEGPILLN